MPAFINPFRSRDASSFPGVLIPLCGVNQPRDAGEEARAEDLPAGDDDDAPLLSNDDLTLERIKAELEKELAASDGDTSYDRKSKIINKAIQDIGMGRYQWELFVLCGMGWLADNLWMQGLALTLPQLSVEFGVTPSNVRYTTMITFVGLSLGSMFWGVASDVIGRRPAFNATLFICGAFGTAIALGPSWIGTSILYSCMGLGVGGNLPVDGALFLEFLPFASNRLLTLLSVWWPVGQLLAAIIGWALIPPFSCKPDLKPCFQTDGAEPCCATAANRGWRYFNATIGVLTLFMFFCRFFLFHLYESPKFCLSRGHQEKAVHVVHGIAHHNGARTWLTEDVLEQLGGGSDVGPKVSVADISRRNASKFSTDRVAALFIERKLAMTTILLWIMWFTIGLGFPLFNAFLPQYLEHAGQNGSEVSTAVAYRNYLITSIVGVPGSIIACFTVDMKYMGRKGTMAISTLISGLFLYFFTLSGDPIYQTLCSSIEALFQNVMYGVLYAYTPEVFPAPVRGTGTGIASLLNRIAGLSAPVVAAQVGAAHPSAPIVLAAIMYLIAFVAMCLLPIETRGKQSL